MAKSKKTTKKIKIKKKKWFEIALPQILKGNVFAESYAETPENLIGRTIKASLGQILSPTKRHMSIKLIIKTIKTSIAHTIIKSIEVSAPYILRKTRKNSKIGVKIAKEIADNVKVDLKVCAITKDHCLTTTKKEIRKILTEGVKKALKDIKKDALVMDLINGNIQNSIKNELKKVYPMKSVELEKVVFS